MITDALDAWILHLRKSGETSAWVTFFTRNHGVIQCLYKGARHPKKQSALQAFTPLWLELKPARQDLFFVRQLEMTSASLSFTKESLFAGLYVNELLYHTLKEQDAHPLLYDAYTQTLHDLNAASSQSAIEMILRRFEWALLCASGTLMSFTEDVSGLPIDVTAYYQLNVEEGFFPAATGIPGAHILAFANDCMQDAAVLKSAKWIMRCAVGHLLGGKVLKVRELYSQINGKIIHE